MRPVYINMIIGQVTMIVIFYVLYFFVLSLFIYLREREHTHEQGRHREGESQAGSMLSEDLDSGLHLMTVRSRPELKSRVSRPTD